MITKQALGSTLFGMADILRDKVEDYKSYILTLLFFKRLSDNYTWENENGIHEFQKEYGKEPNERQKQKIIKNKHDFIIPEGCFWEDVRKAPLDKKNDALNKAVIAISDVNTALKGVINTVRWNEPSPDGSGGKKLHPEVLSLLINYLDAVDLSNKNASVDVLGDAYEYLIKRFADENKGGTTAGQFYTPQEVVDIIVRYLKPQKGITAYDPTCGSGGFLINAAKYIKETTGNQKNIRLFGQEDVWNTWAIANINMTLHGLDALVKKGDTLKDPKFTEENNDLAIKTFDLVMANFPFSQENWWKNGEPKRDKKGKPVIKKDGSPQLNYPDKAEFVDPYERFNYGIPPFSNGDFAFLQHIVASMSESGKAGIVCPQGVLFRGQPAKTEEEDGQKRKADDEYLIRRGFLEGLVSEESDRLQGTNIIDAIVVLPGNLFYGTTIPGSIVFLNKNKPEHRKNKVLMVYAAKEDWFKEGSNMNTLLPKDILRVSTLLESWGDIDIAREWISSQKSRLRAIIQEDYEFKLGEIELDTQEDIEIATEKFQKAEKQILLKQSVGKKPTNAQIIALTKAEEGLQRVILNRQQSIDTACEIMENELSSLDEVEEELITVLADPERRKEYFSVVEMEELMENDYSLSIARYVDIFKAEEEVDLNEAINGYVKSCETVSTFDRDLANLQNLLAGKYNPDGTLSKKAEFKETSIGPIPYEWKLMKAKDLCSRVTDGTHDTPEPSISGYPLVTSKNLKYDAIDFEGCYLISESNYMEINKRSKVEQFDILFGMIGTVGNPQIVHQNPVNFAIKNVGLFKLDGNKDLSLWIKNYLSSGMFETYKLKQQAGTTQQFVSLGFLRKIPIPVPFKGDSIDYETIREINRNLVGVTDALTSKQIQVKSLYTLKKSLLQNLLTGKVQVEMEKINY